MGRFCSFEKSCGGRDGLCTDSGMKAVWVFAVSILFLFGGDSFGQGKSRHVLLLHSYNKGLIWTDGLTRGIESVADSSSMNVHLTTEYMDTKRVNDEKHHANLLAVYRHKFTDTKFDVIITADDNALKFIMEHELELFGDVPVVFCGLSQYTEELKNSEREMTGIVERQSIRETLELALGLHPEAKKMYIINDQTTTGRKRHKQYAAAVEKLSRDVEVEYLGGGSIEELVERLENLPDDSVVIHHNFNRDSNGVLFSHREAGRIISEACKRPIYSSQEHNLGLGVVGGYMTVGEVHGKLAGEMAIEVLEGKNARDIPVIETSPNPAMFDYVQLERWEIPESSLPADSVIINKPFSFYEEYRYRIWSVITVVVLLGGFVVLLSMSIFRRRRAELALRKSESRYRTLVENIELGVTLVDRDHNILFVNQTQCRMFGKNPEDLLGKKCYHEFEQRDEVCAHCPGVIAMSSGKAESVETEGRRDDGSKLEVRIMAFPLYDDGSCRGFIEVIEDITNRKKTEREKEGLMRSLSAKNEELQSIVYAASHDLRSPLVNILGFSTELNTNCEEMLEKLAGADLEEEIRGRVEPLLKDEIPESLEFIKTGAAKMQNLLDGLLQVSRVGTRSIEIRRLHMNDLLGKIVQSISYEIQESGAEVSYEMLPACLGDVNLIDRLFTNLLTNALKYLDPEREGQIRIWGKHEGANSVYCVEDNGIGIAGEHIDNIFELFHRLNPDDRRGGEGLGLTIVMRILDRLDGSIRVESECGKGSKFFVTLPGA